jgi:outer membrane protein assembly factor BamB
MPSRNPYPVIVPAGVVFLALLPEVPGWAPAAGQDPPKPVLAPSLRADAALVRQLDVAGDYLQAESWVELTTVLQALLDRPEDALVAVKRPGKDGKDVTSWTGIRAEAARLLAALPAAGRAVYVARYGPRARALLAEARREWDMDRAAEVVRRYPHTAAAAEAARLLGTFHLDRGRHALAALCFARLLDGEGADRLPPATLLTAALAFRRAGDGARAEQAWARLAAGGGTLRLGGKAIPLADLKRELDRGGVPAPAFGPGGVPGLKARWTRSTLHEELTRTWLDRAAKTQEAREQPGVPASCPVVAGGRVVYRTHGGLHAVDVHTGAVAWDLPLTWSIDGMTRQPRFAEHLESWVQAYLEISPHVLFENAAVGMLVAEGGRVYAVDDLPVPPYRYVPQIRRWQRPALLDFGAELNEAASHSRLLALDAVSGKRVWEVGGGRKHEGAGELSDTYFLGPPLPLDGGLYVLTEKESELAVVCLDASDGGVVWKQALALAPTRLLLDPGRRIQAARPVCSEGVLVCPTNAGVVLGVDVLARGLAWAYPYRGEALTRSAPWEGWRRRPGPPRVAAEWKAPATIVAQGRVVFTAPDEPSVHCLNLRDGSLLWKAGRTEDDLYLAGVVGGKVLLVGKQACRALDLADGKELWQLDTGLPSGRGVAVGSVYYLPLKEAVLEEEPAVYAIDVERGTVRASLSLPRKEVPGNLLLWRGDVLAQTATAVTAYTGRKKAP